MSRCVPFDTTRVNEGRRHCHAAAVDVRFSGGAEPHGHPDRSTHRARDGELQDGAVRGQRLTPGLQFVGQLQAWVHRYLEEREGLRPCQRVLGLRRAAAARCQGHSDTQYQSCSNAAHGSVLFCQLLDRKRHLPNWFRPVSAAGGGRSPVPQPPAGLRLRRAVPRRRPAAATITLPEPDRMGRARSSGGAASVGCRVLPSPQAFPGSVDRI